MHAMKGGGPLTRWRRGFVAVLIRLVGARAQLRLLCRLRTLLLWMSSLGVQRMWVLTRSVHSLGDQFMTVIINITLSDIEVDDCMLRHQSKATAPHCSGIDFKGQAIQITGCDMEVSHSLCGAFPISQSHS